MGRKDTSLRTFLWGITGGNATGTGSFGAPARPISIIESFKILDMNPDVTRKDIVKRIRSHYRNKWMDGITDDGGEYLEFYTNDGLKPNRRVRVKLEFDGESPDYCRVDVEKVM
ncbi:hypothetical protein HOA55_01350 [archaeon]|jgi:hypothetical protein|nr:hypothetical protein [archaeon]MBT3578048.1 hypothetical protein [archaeon]MBT6819979.1 hypothetical protein [archaeon]MBT6956639.1 hypothetical protein [archaeon]MBT7025016.1 hypothetical protein [archaeon]